MYLVQKGQLMLSMLGMQGIEVQGGGDSAKMSSHTVNTVNVVNSGITVNGGIWWWI